MKRGRKAPKEQVKKQKKQRDQRAKDAAQRSKDTVSQRHKPRRQVQYLREKSISSDDPHWPWPLWPHELKGPWWKVQALYMRRLALYSHFRVPYPQHRYHMPPLPQEGVSSAVQSSESVPSAVQSSEGVSSAVQSSEGVSASMQGDGLGNNCNRRPKIGDSWLGVKWASARHKLNIYFQALAVMRYNGLDMCIEACHTGRNLRLMKNAAKAFMNAETFASLAEDIAMESDKRDKPDGMRYFCAQL